MLICCPTRNWYLVGTHTALETAVLTIERTVSRSPPVCGLSAPVPNAPDQARIRSARPGTLQRWSQRLHVLWYDPVRGSGSHQAICRRHTRDLYAIWSQRPFSPPGERGMLPRHRGGRSRTKLITAHPYLLRRVLFLPSLTCTRPYTHAAPLKVRFCCYTGRQPPTRRCERVFWPPLWQCGQVHP